MLLKEMERERETQLTGQIIYKLKVKGWNRPSQQIPQLAELVKQTPNKT